ncbi:MAG: hypothetical protein IJU48_03440 [Synergistaceae bacterium]|nr:hypothetical protein [Synergistaceae bacterium]
MLREKSISKKEIEIEPKAANVLEASREITNEFNNAYVSGNEISNSTMEKFFALTGAKRGASNTASNEAKKEKVKMPLSWRLYEFFFMR